MKDKKGTLSTAHVLCMSFVLLDLQNRV